MKTKFLVTAYCTLLICYDINSYAQSANRTLSNLNAPTAVSQSLLPGTNMLSLGSAGRTGLSWNNLYLGNAIYLKGDITLHAPGIGNLFVGPNAGNTSVSGSRNTACGIGGLHFNSAGTGNTALGVSALYKNTTGGSNTAIGASALTSNTIGNSNTALGAGADVSTGNLSNATAIGASAIVGASNTVRIGNANVTSIGGFAPWTVFSDGRYKKDIKENVAGLAFINSLRPITYTINIQGLNEYYNKGRKQLSNDVIANNETVSAEMKKAEDEASKIVHSGFIAQEVEASAEKLNYEFSGVDKPQSPDGLYGLRYDNFVVPLVKAVQELSKTINEKDAKINTLQNQNDEEQKEIDELKSEIRNLKSEIAELKSVTITGNSLNTNLSDVSLAQNTPNPFVNTTIINYSLPQKFTTAQIVITDKNGKQLKQLNISGAGRGSLNIDASTLSSGTYNYSLIVDGKITSTKQMILAK